MKQVIITAMVVTCAMLVFHYHKVSELTQEFERRASFDEQIKVATYCYSLELAKEKIADSASGFDISRHVFTAENEPIQLAFGLLLTVGKNSFDLPQSEDNQQQISSNEVSISAEAVNHCLEIVNSTVE